MSPPLPRVLTDPLGSVNSLFDAAAVYPSAGAEDGDWGVRAAFREALGQLSQRELVDLVPEINAVGVDLVRPGTLVRFRCMVQDMYNPEYYVGSYRDTGGRWITTKYSEDLGPSDAESQVPTDRKIWERRVLYCVPLPGESAWVRRLDGAGVGIPPRTPTKTNEDTANAKAKRRRDDEDVEMGEENEDAADLVAAALAGAGELPDDLGSKKQHHGDNDDSLSKKEGGAPTNVNPDTSTEDALNLPLGRLEQQDGLWQPTPCIVKMYDDEGTFCVSQIRHTRFAHTRTDTFLLFSQDEIAAVKLNDVLELVGVLGIAPELSLAAMADAGGAGNAGQSIASIPGTQINTGAQQDFDFMDEERAHNPPTSVVPRFHVLAARRASAHGFVCGQVETAETAETAANAWQITSASSVGAGGLSDDLKQKGASFIRGALIDHLAAPLGGDQLAAEYVLFTLLSRVHTRSDGMPIGKFGITLLGVPDGPAHCGVVASLLSRAVAQIAPAVAHLPLSIASLNARPWAPRKDYSTNRLRSGPLQLAPGTVVVLDETQLTQGTLSDVGVRNVRSLVDTTTSQTLEMDFQFHQTRVATDLQFINVSSSSTSGLVEGMDASVVLRMTQEPCEPETVDQNLLSEMRLFLARARNSEHRISKQAGADIEKAMVCARSSDPNEVTQEKFHRWLTMARLNALSVGETDLGVKHWNAALECERVAAERARVC
jgi:hypothetical protein|tara:strand:+ start:141 stop:2282 length:2142 start_codon:yes stop_codon:yes gene_type:complete